MLRRSAGLLWRTEKQSRRQEEEINSYREYPIASFLFYT